jgi:acetylornithine/succinyldiaminopimelate/putrescine aminotransferase
VPVDFYRLARELTREHGSLLLIDSIQAALRVHGTLSFVDYPGHQELEAPDMETYSKALNGAQFPLSVLAVTEHAAALYRKGVYGNTMTTNPRALDVACATLARLDEPVRNNIRLRGQQAMQKLEALKERLGGAITKVQGTGLLFSCELAPQYKCYGAGSTEEWLRMHGVNVIHGGENSLRFTPHFGMDEAELDLLVEMVGRALVEGPRRA